MKRSTMLPRFFAASTLLVALAATAQKEAPQINGPSVLRATETATVTGVKFPANAAVTVVVASPSGAKAAFGAVADANGNLSHSFVGSAAGKWTVTITDSGGRALAKATVNIVQ